MKSNCIIAAVLSLAAFASAFGSRPAGVPPRPNVVPAPFDSGRPMPFSPPRDEGRFCHVKPSCNGSDTAPRILRAFEECNDGGTIVLDHSYRIGSPLDLTFLKHVDVVITGEVHFSDDDVYYWAENSFKFSFQNQSTFWKFGGEDINIYGDLTNGKSLIDGHGQAYWEEIVTNKTVNLADSSHINVIVY